MSAVADSLVREFVKFFSYAVDDFFIRASRKVGTADATAEKSVAGDKETLLFTIETAATFGVTWSMDDLQFIIAYVYNLIVEKLDARIYGMIFIVINSECSSISLSHFKVLNSVGMRCHWNVEFIGSFVVSEYMIDVSVSVQNHDRF